jgi:hypothetical protein
MFADEIRRAVEAAPRMKLPEVSAILWRAFAAGQVSEAEAEALSSLIEIRRALPVAPKPMPRHTGSRPRSPASLERRRSWTASGRLPPTVAARFTPGEAAVLAVVAVEVCRSGDCRWPHGRLAGVAGVSISTVRRALRQARDLGLITVEERRLGAFRSDTNIVRVVSPEWRAWLHLGGGGQSGTPTTSRYSKPAFVRGSGSLAGARRGEKGSSARPLEGPPDTRKRLEP